jgi:hypothetical protein
MDKTIGMDIMLDFAMMKAATATERKCELVRRLFDEVPQVLSKYKIADFNKDAFVTDFRAWIKEIGWL